MKWYIVLLGVLVLGLIAGGIYMNNEGITIQNLLSNNLLGIVSAVEWQINTSVWDGSNSNFSAAAQSGASKGLFFKPDGTKMYVLGDLNNMTYSYSLSTPWMINTSVWDGSASNFSVGAQDVIVEGLFFKSDGTKMYVVGAANNIVYSYSLSTPWMINTSVWDGSASNFSVTTQDGTPAGLFFKPDGTKMYIMGQTNTRVYQYSLSTAWQVNTSTYDINNISVISQESSTSGLFFKSDGTKMYVIGFTGDRIYSYSLSTAWQVNTSVWDGSASNLSVGSQDSVPSDLFFNSDGTKVYVMGQNVNRVYQYTMPPVGGGNCWTYNSPTKYLQIPTGCLYTGNLTP